MKAPDEPVKGGKVGKLRNVGIVGIVTARPLPGRLLCAAVVRRLVVLATVAMMAAPYQVLSAAERAPLSASLDRSTLAARGKQSAILTVNAFGRYAVTAASAQGVALQVVDRMAGAGATAGEASKEDGRLDLFLDRGAHKIVAQGRETYGGLQETASSRNGLILPSETRTLAEIVRALAAVPKADARQPLLVDALVTLGQGDGWGSTQANASAMLALADILKGRPGKGEVHKLGLTVGPLAHTLEIGPRNPVVPFATSSAAKIGLRSQASKPLIVRAETSYLAQALGSQAPAGASGFVVTRELSRLRGEGEPTDKIRLATAGTTVRLSVGDFVEDHVEVISNGDHHFVAVSVPLAAGMEPLNPNLATAPPEAAPSGQLTAAPSYVAYLDDQVTFYYDRLPKGTHHFYFRTRATVAGQFTQPQAKAQLMYDEAVHGESVGARVEVSPAGR